MFPKLEDVAAVIALVTNHGDISQTRLLSQMRERTRTIAHRSGGEFVCGLHHFQVQGTDEIGYRVTMMMQRPVGWRQWLKVTDESYLSVKRAEELDIPIV